MTQPTDLDLWRRIHDDDPDAFGQLFERHGPTVHRYAVRRTADPTAADDIVSLVFLEVWRRRKQVVLHQPAALPWLYGVAANVLRAQGRARRRHAHALERLAALPGPSAVLVERQVEASVATDSILRQIDALPRRYQEVLILSVVEHLSHAEIAVALDISAGTVKSRLSRARSRLDLDAPRPVLPTQLPHALEAHR